MKTNKTTTKTAAKTAKTTKKAAKASAKRVKRTAAETAKLAAKVAKLRDTDELSFREIEAKLAKELGLDPSRAFGGFVAFRLYGIATAKPAVVAALATKKTARVAKRVPASVAAKHARSIKTAANTKTAPNGANVIA